MSAPITFIHGWGMTPAVWRPLLAHLDPDRPLRTLALPGHDDAAGEALDTWIDRLAPALPTDGVLCGWSLGGQLAMRLAQHAPDRCARLILIGTTPCFVQRPDWSCALDATTVAGFRHDFDAAPEATAKRFVALQAVGDRARREVTRTLGAALTPIQAHNQAALADALGVLCDTDLRDTLGRITCPVRILHGAGDALMPAAAAEAMAEALPEARLSIFDDCGHAPFIGRPRDCAVLIDSFCHD
ncbi:alpha/beta fold hydrolase [Nitrogeniibacter mangrovi]|uniref:Alpha/beta fold hydrolase n=1 Tax=Nitrogeniibacter mangrovi TaxID=2016596 RepID=A0A6C1B3Q0_9RHOO|nr:alpha/beta fold hydrolase [Nitrogeniibacter mangrovi]QID18013.1 alpha/beta fold hydrolase [Nitrogeniibacter mangrovi]